MGLSWTCHVCLRTKITFINILHFNYLTLALEDQRRQLGRVEEKGRDQMKFGGFPEGGKQAASQECSACGLLSRHFIEMQQESSTNEVKLSSMFCLHVSFGWCGGRKTVSFLWWQAFSFSLQTLLLPVAWAHPLAEAKLYAPNLCSDWVHQVIPLA